jgi:hypothetical protein
MLVMAPLRDQPRQTQASQQGYSGRSTGSNANLSTSGQA